MRVLDAIIDRRDIVLARARILGESESSGIFDLTKKGNHHVSWGQNPRGLSPAVGSD